MQQRQFDPWQREAIEISGGRHVVLAPPGCGKTIRPSNGADTVSAPTIVTSRRGRRLTSGSTAACSRYRATAL